MGILDISSSAPHVQVQSAGAQSGLGIFATRSLDTTDALISIERPLIAALDAAIQDDTCYQCLRRSGDVSPDAQLGFQSPQEVKPVKLSRCAGCKMVWYCAKVSHPVLTSTFSSNHLQQRDVYERCPPNTESGIAVLVSLLKM